MSKKKSIKEFKQGDFIMLGQCAWVRVVGDAFVEDGVVHLRVHLLGLMHSQLIVFNESENFEYEEAREG